MIGLTSDFIPKAVFMFVYSEDTSLKGYVNFTLSSELIMNWMKGSAQWLVLVLPEPAAPGSIPGVLKKFPMKIDFPIKQFRY